ncbi:Tudor and KH domain-containing [Nymphon striatum]|nr:Tudor and KH domain-containing [Nymphon striatum]
MYTSDNNNCTVKIRDKSIDLKETKDPYGRLMVLARSSRDVDQKEASGNFEFTLTPRALFAPSGSLLPCNDKSKLIHALTNLVPKETTQTPIIPDKKIAVIDGMVLVQKQIGGIGLSNCYAHYCLRGQVRMIMQTNKHIVKEINVPIDVVGNLIGRQGTNIKAIQEKTRTRIHFKDFDLMHTTLMTFIYVDEDADVESRTALIRGSVNDVKSAAQKIQRFIEEQPKIITEEIHVPQFACGFIIGKGGENIRAMSHSSKAKISIESNYSDDEHLSLVTIRGSQEQIDVAKELIHEKVICAEKKDKRNISTVANKTINEKKKFNETSIQHQLALTAPPNAVEDPSIEDARYEQLLPSSSDGFIETYSSAVINPSKFYLQNIGPRSIELDKMMEDMTKFYCDEMNRKNYTLSTDLINIKVGDIVAAPFTNDAFWYRAEIKKITPNDYDPSLNNLEIFYVDFGDIRNFDLKDVCSLNETFLDLPFQAIECCLHGVQPRNSMEWSDEAIKTFEGLIYQGEWKIILSKVISNINRDGRNVAVVEIIDTYLDEDVDLSLELINKRYAEASSTFDS